MALRKISNAWDALVARHGWARVYTVALILLIGIASIAVRMLVRYEFQTTALLYVGLPYLISLAIAAFKPVSTTDKWWHQYRDHTLTALMVFLASSVVLFEGFVCIAFFLPIYFFVVSIGFLISWMAAIRKKRGGGTTYISLLPLLIIAASLEGTTESLSSHRGSHVIVSKIANLSTSAIMRNIATPFDLQKSRHWMLSIFPMPYEIDAGSLNAGDVHIARTRYHRWFVTNSHEGELQLQIMDVDEHTVRTRIIHDTTLFSSYLKLLGTQITLIEISPGKTEITLQINYERKLDPAWYFHPLQQYGVSRMGEFLIDEVMIRDH